MAVKQGYDSSFLVGEQTVAWSSPVTIGASMIFTQFEPQSFSLRNISTPAVPERLRGHASAVKNVPDQYSVEGDIVMHAHGDHHLVFLKQVMGGLTSSVSFTPVEIKAAFTWVNATAVSLDNSFVGVSADPGTLIFSYAASAQGPGSIAISGTDQNGFAISETISVSTATTPPPLTTSAKFYQTVDVLGVTLDGFTVANSVVIYADRDTTTHTFSLADAIGNGLTIEGVKGSIPNTYHGMLVNQLQVTAGPTMQMTYSMIGRRGILRQNLLGNSVASDPGALFTYPHDNLDGFAMTEDVHAGWGLGVMLDSSVFPVADYNMTFNNQLAHPPRMAGERTRQKPVRTGLREITATLSMDYDDVANIPDWDAKFEADNTFPMTVSNVLLPDAGREYRMDWYFQRVELVSYTDPEVNGPGDITQTLELKILASAASSLSNEAQLFLVSKENGLAP